MGIETLSRGRDNHNDDRGERGGAVPAARVERAGAEEPGTQRLGGSASGGSASGGSAPSGEEQAAELLARVRAVVDPALRAAVESMPESMSRVAAYHFGWREADGSPSGADAGKAIRPALVLAAAQACAGPDAEPAAVAAAAVRAAAAVELVHNFTLLHDDVIDRDETRRHRPTAWLVFGATEAILAGDAMHSLALRTLAEDPHPAAGDALRRLAHCVVELCDGQQADCAFERRSTVSLDECLAMAEAKTGALLGAACAIGALYGGASARVAEEMDAFGREIGLAFQLIDDLIGIWGDPAVTGKPVGADLLVRKKSLPVVAALGSGTPAGAELAEIYALDRPLTADEVRRATEAVERAGGRAWAQGASCERMATAIEHLALAVPDPEAAEDLLALAELVTRRNR
ncbi:family 2 encapsulin nanocompartment cargo protein polyprenyl transferase [Kitasatospora sp. NBC_01287]|uniref:family 2 encapsulin nanocompartment cargo protein polyprenyl transferase n=1 Tax=Kitasatospora sp. NBC_01287 TaxID=2903573 RepID=UPI00224DAC60|nr:family 2 encapsulin nanocompartment cargo protein polyprenyl transferase [Kitasatospora sp. NBC_01287]MCX4748254.1 family 2 encapsulin nanocompartment cargo protein polyprenyl transferase [Kitasatospora sp. NBC_01287]